MPRPRCADGGVFGLCRAGLGRKLVRACAKGFFFLALQF
jgi:hypothetical protein